MQNSIPAMDPQHVAKEIYKRNVQLLQDRRHAEQLLFSVSDIVFALDTEFKLTIVNHTAKNLLNLDTEAVLGKHPDNVFQLKLEDGSPIKATGYAFKIEPAKSKVDGLVLNTPYGDMYVNLKTSIITDDDKFSECVVTLSDVTKEKLLDKAKDEFVNIASHELRSPLTIIKSYLWMLANNKAGELNDKQKGYLDKTISGTDRMLSLVNDYLNVARIEQGRITLNIELVDYASYVQDIYDELKVKTDEKNLHLAIESQENMPKVYIDKVRLREVVVNLVSNATKFTNDGTITVKAESTSPEEIMVKVIDTGKGIKSEDIAKLFTKFGRIENALTTGDKAGGTGLGLYIVKSLIEKMGGKSGVESEGLGKGSTFWFTLLTENSKNKISSIVL